MKRVLRIINRFNLGGPTYNAAYLSKYLAPEYETLLIGGIHDDTEESSKFILRDLGVHAIVIPEMQRSINGINDVQAYRKIKNIIKKFQPHIVHTHASKAGMLGRMAAFDMGVPVVVHTFHGHVFHSYFNALKTKTFIHIERRLAKKTDAIIAISPKQKEELAIEYKIAPPEKFEVIPLGLDLTRFVENQEEKRYIFRKENQLEDDEIAVAIVGRLVPVKNHQLFIKALAEAKKRTIKKIRAFIVGDGECRTEIEALAHRYNLTISLNGSTVHKPDVRFSGWVKEVDYVYAGVDVVMLTSLNEGTPVSLIEAQAAGKPIVSTDVGGVHDILIPNASALLSPPNSEELFIENFIRLIENEQLRKSMANVSRDFVLSQFSYERLINDMDKLYQKLLYHKKVEIGQKEFV